MIIELANRISDALPYYILLFVRMSGLFLLSPIFGRKNLPNQFKIGFCLILTVLLATATPPDFTLMSDGFFGYTISILKELTVGLTLGFITTMFFSLTLIAGQIIDVEMGLGVGGVFDPQLNIQTSVSGTMLNLLMLIYFLVNNGHLKLIRLLVASVEVAPVGKITLLPQLATLAVEQFSMVFGLAVSLMLPLIGAALLTETALGMLMRAIPQLNAYMVGIPLKTLVGLMVLALMQPVYSGFCDEVFNQIFNASKQMIQTMGA